MRNRRPIRIEGDVAIVPLTRGYEAIIDVLDVDLVSSGNWAALISPRRKAIYACRTVRKKMILMHRVIRGAALGEEIDHVDGDGLNNRRHNLRLCSRSQNCANVGLRSDNKTGVKGVFLDTRSGKWRVQIKACGQTRGLGLFSNFKDACARRRKAEQELHLEFARSS